jgi:Restriction endonuclease S subunits
MSNNNKTPAIRFKGFTDTWEQRKLGELGTITTGSTPSTDIPDYYSDDGIVWVTPTDICENITFESARKLSDLGQQVGRVVPKNTILVTCIASIGKNTMLGNTGSFNQQINGLTPNENECDPYFLLTESALWSAKMKSSAAAGTMQIVNRTEFSELKTWLPSLIEQQAISDFFRQLDHLITLHQRKYDKLIQFKEAMLQKMFPQNSANKPEIRFKGFTDAWEQRKVGEWGNFYYGHSCPKWSVTEDATTPCIRYGEMYTKFGCKIDRVYSYTNIPKENLKFSKGTEVLVPRVGEDPMDYNHCTWLSLANVAIGEMISVYNTEQNPLFTAIMFNATLKYEFAKRVEGGSVTNLYYEKLLEIPVSFPNIEEQKKIASLFGNFDNLITLHQRKCDKYKSIKAGLIRKLFP